jgi:hypothetical protein
MPVKVGIFSNVGDHRENFQKGATRWTLQRHSQDFPVFGLGTTPVQGCPFLQCLSEFFIDTAYD